MKKFELTPQDGKKSFYGKCYVIEDGNTATLYSYDSKIVTLNTDTGEIEKYPDYNYGQTTKRHQKAFFNYYGIKEA